MPISLMSDRMFMVPLWIIIGLIVSGVSVSTLGAYFSIKGIGALFSGALVAVWIMAASLELSKFVLAAYLHRKWYELAKLYRAYLVSSVIILSLITSMGIFGFLSEAYQSASAVLELETVKLQSLQVQLDSSKNEILRLNRSIDEIPENRISRRMQVRREIEPQISSLTKQVDQINSQISQANILILEAKNKVGPLIYISKAFNVNVDDIVKYFIFTFVLVFDPLAICLIIAVSEALDSRNRKPELSTTPVTTAGNVAPEEDNKLTSKDLPPATPEEDVIQMKFVEETEKPAV